MKIKVVVVDLEISSRAKRRALMIGIPVLTLLCGSVVAWAAGLTTWKTGDTLQAADLNANFALLQSNTPLVTTWTSFTPVIMAGTTDMSSSVTIHGAYWRRVGDTMDVTISSQVNACPGPAAAMSWSIPLSGVVDGTKLGGNYLGETGDGAVFDGSADKLYTLLFSANPDGTTIGGDESGTGAGGFECATHAVPYDLRMRYSVPIKGWTVNGL